MSRDRQRLYDLLPSYIRFQDQEQGQPLEALMGVLDLEYHRLHHGMQRLYEDWFIETCQSWLVPFIGDLVGLDRLEKAPKGRYTWRPLVAKAIAQRRFKGTVTCLERATRDATGWSAYAQAQSDAIAWTQDTRAPIAGFGGFIDIRNSIALDRLGTPFDRASHTADIRSRPQPFRFDGGSLFSPNGISVWLWRIDARPIWRGAPKQVTEGGYTFDPFGQDVPLYIQPQAPTGERMPVKETELPLPLSIQTLDLMLEELRHFEIAGQVARSPVRDWLQIFDVDCRQPIPLHLVAAWDLSEWRRPGPEDYFCREDEQGIERKCPILAAIDPERGRLTLADADTVNRELDSPEIGDEAKTTEGARILVSYSFGQACDIGGGPHYRSLPILGDTAWRALVLTDGLDERSPDFVGPRVFSSLEEALAQWPKEEAKGHIRILGSGRLDVSDGAQDKGTWAIDLTGRKELIIEASEGTRPFLCGDFMVCGHAFEQATRLDSRQPLLRLAGLWLDGSITLSGSLELWVQDSTVAPPLRGGRRGGTEPEPILRADGALKARDRLLVLVRLEDSILGPIRLPQQGVACEIRDSVIDGAVWCQEKEAVAYSGAHVGDPGPAVRLERTTVLGELRAQSIEATDTYFCRRPEITRLTLGFLRYCFTPTGESGLPPQTQVLPPESPIPCCQAPGWETAVESENWLVSIVYGDPGYAQLSASAPRELMTSGTDGSAIGVVHGLYEAERLDRLPTIFGDTLRSGMAARAVLIDGCGPKLELAGLSASPPPSPKRQILKPKSPDPPPSNSRAQSPERDQERKTL